MIVGRASAGTRRHLGSGLGRSGPVARCVQLSFRLLRSRNKGTITSGRLASFAALVACTVPVAAMAPSGHALAAAELRVTVGVDGRYEPGDPIVLRVAVTADELIDGEIVVTMRGMSTSTRRDVQVAAGTTKEFYFALPSSWEEPTFEVTVRDGDAEVAAESARARQRTSGEVVGVLPRLTARLGELPGEVALADGIGQAAVGELPLDVIDLGVAALRSYDSIAAGAEDLAELDERQRDALFAWVSLGGILMLDDDAAVDDLPEAWQPGPMGNAWADLGEIRLTDGQALSGEWAEIVQPTIIGSPAAMGSAEMMIDPQQDLARRAGLDLPSITPLVLGIAGYAIVLGPVVYFVLRRMRRLTLGWFVIPAVAVLTAGGVAVAGGGALRNGNPATATFVQDSAAGGYAMSNVLTFSDSGGRADVDLPAGWALAGANEMFWGNGRLVPIEIIRNGDGTSRSSVTLESTQANVRMYAGTTTSSGLTTTAVWDGDRDVSGTITNGTDVTLHDVAVFAGEDEALVGDLAPGETADWSMSAVRNLRFNWDMRGAAVWGEPFGGPVPFDREVKPLQVDGDVDTDTRSMVEFGVWGAASGDVEMFPSGMARVVGWTDELPSLLIPDDDTSSRTVVTSLSPVTGDDGAVNAATIRSIAVRSPFFGPVPGNLQVFRYVLPTEADPDELFVVGVHQVDAEEIAFWDGGEWVEGDATLDAIPVPDDAIRGGVVLVRTDVDMNRGPVGIPGLTDQAPAGEPIDDDAEEDA